MYRFEMVDHRVNGREFFRTDATDEVFGLLMLVQEHLIFETFFAVIAKWFEVSHVSLASAHLV